MDEDIKGYYKEKLVKIFRDGCLKAFSANPETLYPTHFQCGEEMEITIREYKYSKKDQWVYSFYMLFVFKTPHRRWVYRALNYKDLFYPSNRGNNIHILECRDDKLEQIADYFIEKIDNARRRHN